MTHRGFAALSGDGRWQARGCATRLPPTITTEARFEPRVPVASVCAIFNW